MPFRQCVLGWILATCVFVGLTALLGGPTQADDTQSLYATWTAAHGEFQCMYLQQGFQHVPPDFQPLPAIAPLWPLISGGTSAVLRIGDSVPFPSQTALGTNCTHAYAAMYLWAETVFPVRPTIGVGYLGWLVLVAGVVAYLRAMGRGRRGWELVTVMLIAVLPIVWMPLIRYFHPQDYVALGLALIGIAFVKKSAWVWAGVAMGLAVTSQQYALLALIPAVLVVPAFARWRMVVAAACSWAVVTVPIIIATDGRALEGSVFGSGSSASFGGALVWELHLHGAALVALSRVTPLLAAAGLSFWSHRRLAHHALDPVPLTALIATCFSMRLVFEETLLGYYFLALAVMLILLDVVRGRIRGELIVWLALVTFAFNPVPFGIFYNARSWGKVAFEVWPVVLLGVFLVLVIWDLAHGRLRWYIPVAFVLMLAALGHWPWEFVARYPRSPYWLTQIVLVGSGVLLAGGPLVAMLRAARPGLDNSKQQVPSPA